MGYRRSTGPRTMYKATCSDCGQECDVPFKPTDEIQSIAENAIKSIEGKADQQIILL